MDPIVSALVKWTQSPIKSLLPFVQASNLAVKAYADSRYSNSKALSKVCFEIFERSGFLLNRGTESCQTTQLHSLSKKSSKSLHFIKLAIF